MRTVYEFSVKDRKGKEVSLKEYANEVLLIVTLQPSAVSPLHTKNWRHFMRNTMHRGLKFLIFLVTNLDNKHLELTRVFTNSANLHMVQSSLALRK